MDHAWGIYELSSFFWFYALFHGYIYILYTHEYFFYMDYGHVYYGLWMLFYTYVLANDCKHMHLQHPQPSPPPAASTRVRQSPQFLQGINHANHLNRIIQLIPNKQIQQIVNSNTLNHKPTYHKIVRSGQLNQLNTYIYG